jgi:subtilisin family serine protease
VGRAGTNFRHFGGTSIASPHMASVAALMLQKNPTLTLTQAQVKRSSKAPRLRFRRQARALPPRWF